MPFIGLSLLIAIVAIVHVIKTGRSQLWIMVLLALPGLGAIAYFVVEVLPEYMNGRGGHQVKRSVTNVFTPNKNLEEAKRDYSITPTVENACILADAYVEKQEYQEASNLYNQSLSGLNKYNPDIMYKYANSEFHLKRYDETRSVLDLLIEKNPDYKNQDAHLLYAKTLHALGENDKASEEYETLIGYYTGPEPAYRYGLLLKSVGSDEDARKMFSSILDKSSQSPDHYRKLHRQWINLAREELSLL